MLHATKPSVEIDLISEYTTVTFILSGEQNMRLGDRSFIAGGGNMLFIPFQLPISTRFLPHAQAQFTGVSLVLDEQWLADIAARTSLLSDNVPVFGVGFDSISPAIQDCLYRLIALLGSSSPTRHALAECYKHELALYLLESRLKNHLLAFCNQNSQLQKIKKACHYLQVHWAEKLTVARLTELSGMGQSAFYQHFKMITGYTPLQYQKSIRLNHAKNLILKRDLPITQIAYQVGYESANQFSREYKRMFGTTPKEDHQAV
ncbi:helix-turn-helix domain-containing protein [Neisseria sp. CCUG17229]|uniref:helix-turn-helix transcriptional regulator n=1 Tax=Neisseria sp. CCUG17229 TaxID=3392036 RepID=UPI003A0FF35A